jgi:hypothetical protein
MMMVTEVKMASPLHALVYDCGGTKPPIEILPTSHHYLGVTFADFVIVCSMGSDIYCK